MKSGSGCHFLKELVATRADQIDAASEILGTEPVGSGDLNEIMEGTSDEVLEQIQALVSVFRVEDPVAATVRLTDSGVRASPVHGLGHMNHIAYMPGTKPAPTQVATTPQLAASSPNRVVAVVDSGVTGKLPGWLESGLLYDPEDVEVLGAPGDASHGTFVSGVIRRIAPEHTISMARPRSVVLTKFSQPGPSHKKADDMTTELHVLEAIIRLVHRHRHNAGAIEALNLSLGGVTCAPGDPWMVALAQGLDYWRRYTSRCVPIFAAGGNTEDPRPVFPGAFGHVRAVAAAEEGGREIVWDFNQGAVDPPGRRAWIDDVAPGQDLVSVGGGSKTEWVKWSGSSFATAVATACYVSRRPMEAHDGLIWWRNHHVRYADIPGLLT